MPRAAGAEAGRRTLLAPQRFGMLSSLQPVEHLLVTDDDAGYAVSAAISLA